MAQVAVGLTDGFDDMGFVLPAERLAAAGHGVVVVGSVANGRVSEGHRRTRVAIDISPQDARVGDFDALLLPGGDPPWTPSLDAALVNFVRQFAPSGKPLAAACSGPLLLLAAGVVEGCILTSHHALRHAMFAAGAAWVNQSVVVDGNLITARGPADLVEFCDAVLRALPPAKGTSGRCG